MNQLKTFIETYQKLDREHLGLLENIYSSDIVFTDPIHTISGFKALKTYFIELYKNADSVVFNFTHQLEYENQAFIQWNMVFRHPRLAKGSEVHVAGASHLIFNTQGKVAIHRDYFDLGAMIYEHIPIVGGLIRHIKKRLET